MKLIYSGIEKIEEKYYIHLKLKIYEATLSLKLIDKKEIGREIADTVKEFDECEPSEKSLINTILVELKKDNEATERAYG